MKTIVKRAQEDVGEQEKFDEKGPSPTKRKEKVDSILSREERVVVLKTQ